MKTNFIKFYTFFIALFCTATANAQLVSGDLFLQGKYLEVGLASNGTLGSGKGSPASYHPSLSGGTQIAIVSDPAKDGWGVGIPIYFGDYILPGVPMEEWGLKVNGVMGVASRAIGDSSLTGGMTGHNIGYSWFGDVITGTWAGQFSGLNILQNVSIDVNNLYVLFSVKISNKTSTTIRNIYYNRSVDADNEQTSTSDFTTKNLIENQLPNVDNHVSVSAAGTMFNAYLGLHTVDCRAKSYMVIGSLTAGVGFDSLYNGKVDTNAIKYKLGYKETSDGAIGLVYKLDSLQAGDSTILTYAYLLEDVSLDSLKMSSLSPKWFYKGTLRNNNDTINTCEGYSIDLKIVDIGFKNWVWDSSSLLATTMGPENTIMATGTHTYRAIRTNASTCNSVDTMMITVRGIPFVKPTLTKVDSTLSLHSGYSSYQWYRNDTFLVGATDSIYKMTSNGKYYVSVTDSNGCYGNSDTLVETVLKINNFSPAENLKIAPNPTLGNVRISYTEPVTILVTDISGRVLLLEKNAKEIQLNSLVNGLYFLRILNAKGDLLKVEKVLKQ